MSKMALVSLGGEFDSVGEVSAVGLKLPKKMPYERWVAVGEQLARFHEASSWAIADWLFYGEWEYGRRYEDALELTGLGYQALADLKYVAGRFQISRRREKLSLSHHREVAGLPPADADELLAEAEEQGWSRNRLREAVVARTQPRPPAASRRLDESVVEEPNVLTLVARFWNEDGVEMPSLYRNEQGELSCTWNYLLLVAPDRADAA